MLWAGRASERPRQDRAGEAGANRSGETGESDQRERVHDIVDHVGNRMLNQPNSPIGDA